MFVYKFTHIESNRSYIGQTTRSPDVRKADHIRGSRSSPKTYHFHNALKKYGSDAFTFEVLASTDSLENLNKLEEFYVEKFDSINNGFNIRKAGSNKTHSPESIIRMKEAQKAAHARRRAQQGGTETHNPPSHKGKTGVWFYSEEKKKRHSESLKISQQKLQGKTWKTIDGKRVWLDKEAAV